MNNNYDNKECDKTKEQLEDAIKKTFHDLRTYAGLAINSLDLIKYELSKFYKKCETIVKYSF